MNKPSCWGLLRPGNLLTPQAMVGQAPSLERHRHGQGKSRLEMSLHEKIVPVRRIVQLVAVARPKDPYCDVELRINHLGEFDKPRAGQYAWQSAVDRQRRIQVPTGQIAGTQYARNRLVEALARNDRAA